jgi:HAE1 family hydrophobic/amphiphilic exporter-1
MPSFSLRNPYLIVVGALLVAILGVTAFKRMPVDVFPRLHIKAAVVATFYPGYAPLAMEQDITSRYERFFTLGSGIEHIESRSLPGVSLVTVYFHSNVNMDAAAANLATLAMGDLGLMPPGTLPPLVLKYNASSSIPVILVTVTGPYGQTELQNQARYNVRNFMATVQGASVPYPFGGKIRQIMAYVHSQALQALGLTPMAVVRAINATNQILPAGDAKIGPYDYYIYANAEVPTPKDIDHVPVELGPGRTPVMFGSIGKAKEAAEIQYNLVLIDGKPAVYIPIFKQTGANTLQVITGVKQAVRGVTGLSAGEKVQTLFSQEDTILDAVHSLEHEAASGAILASLMILIFLGNFKSTFAIFLSIPLSILAGIIGLYFSGATINIMTLGGFTLAIGRLVDDSTVVLENINRHLTAGEPPEVAAREGAEEVTYAVLASTITTIVVFLPVVFLFGVAKYLFSALALAVVFSMAASYVVSMSIIPLFCARYLTAEDAENRPGDDDQRRGLLAAFDRAYERFAARFARLLDRILDHKTMLIAGVSALFAGSMLMFPLLGQRLFPRTDAGKFVIDIRTPVGTRLELTEAAARQVTDLIRQVIPPHDLKTVVANLGVVPNVSAIYTSNSGEDTGEVMVSLKEGHSRSTFYYENRLRRAFAERMPDLHTFFVSGSIIDAVLNFGSAAPIDVQLSGPMTEPFPSMFAFARRIERQIERLPQVRQSEIREIADYPTLVVNVDRARAARLGVTERQVVTNLITAIDNNEMIKPSIWIDPISGDDYYLSAQYFEKNIDSLETLRDVPVARRVDPASVYNSSFTPNPGEPSTGEGHEQSVLLRDVATLSHAAYPSEADHYNIQRVVDVMVAPRTSDLGGTLEAVRHVVQKLHAPRNIKIYYRGSVEMMEKTFASFKSGFILAIVVVYLVGVAQGRSWLDPFIFLFSIPMGLIGVVWMLWATGTTINIESMMGVIVMIGIVHSNAILLIDFANERRHQGMGLRRAAVEAARIRMRPILMTSLATVAGLLPVAMKLEAGSEASAPLARSVIGGLSVSTVMTLFLVPALWELFYSWKGKPENGAAT